MIYKICKDNSKFYIKKIDNQHYLLAKDCKCQISCVAGITQTLKNDIFQCNNVSGHTLPSNYFVPTGLAPYNINLSSNILAKNTPSAMDQLCSEISPTILNISNKITISIKDPIFSGTYVFNKSGVAPTGYITGDWIFSVSESKHNLKPYKHSDHPEFDNKILLCLNEGQTNKSISGLHYDGYLETKTTTADLAYYKSSGDNDFVIGWESGSSSEKILQDIYAFPSYFTFTAIQPPCPCSGSLLHSGNFQYSSIGHRLSTGMTLPIRYRPPYGDWILIDNQYIPHIISGITNYASGAPFNNGCSYTDINNNIVYPNNAHAIQYCSGSPYNSIVFDINSCTGTVSGAYSICSEIPNNGFAFKSSCSGFPVYESGRGHNMYPGTNISGILGIGNMQWYDKYPSFITGIGKFYCDINQNPNVATPSIDDRTYFKIIDSTPLFDNKQPISATWRFNYSCRPRYDCTFTETYGDYKIESGLKINCNINPYLNGSGFIYNPIDKINTELLCPDTMNPSSGLFSSIDNITITYNSYVYDTNSGIACLAQKQDSQLVYWDIYVPTGNNYIINIPYTGDINYISLKNWINNNLSVFVYNTGLNIISDYLPSLDIYYQITGINDNNLDVKIFANDEYKPINILVSGAGSAGVNGVYSFDENTGAFEKDFGSWSIKVIERDGIFNWEIGYFDFADYSDQIYNCSGWRPFYRHSGGWAIDASIINIPTGALWQITDSCFGGTTPMPQTLIWEEN